jgi:putative ABC transport system permease protein
MLHVGNIANAKEGAPMWIAQWIEQLLQDARYALRTLRKSSGFSAVVVLTLALGISMNTAVFSVFNAVVLRPIAYPNAERLLWLSTTQSQEETGIVLGPDFVDWREQATSFDRMAAYGTWDSTLTLAAGPTRVRLANVTEDFWDLTGARPTVGRLPRPGERDIVVLSHAFAQRWFPGDADVIGLTVTMEGDQATVVGVLPEDFRFHLPGSPWPGFRPKAIDIYQPVFISPLREGMIGMFNVVGRLKPGVTLEQARAEIQGIRARIIQEHPNPFHSDDQRMLRVIPLHDQLTGGARLALWVLLAAVGFVLLIACANAANLLLARASTRHNEIAIRVSLGAGRFRVLQQCLMESLVLAVLGCAAGLLVARFAVTSIARLGPQSVPRLAEATIDGPVLAVAVGLTLLTAFGFGLAPALGLRRVNAQDALRDGAKGASPPVAAVRARSAILGAQIALALVLLIGAGLMLKSAWRLAAHPPGFEPERILTMKIEFTDPQYSKSEARQLAFVDALLDGLGAQPGVEAASISTHGYMLTEHLFVEGAPETSREDRARRGPIMVNATSAALSRVMGLRMMRGRWIADNEPTAVINERLAQREFSGQDPIGRRIRLDESGPLMTIVGIVADLRYSRLDAAPEPELYVPYAQVDGMFGFIALVRTTGDPVALVPAIRSLLERIDKTQILDEVMTLQQLLAETIAPRRWNLYLLGTFAMSALVLALIGMYGLMTYWVIQRHQEIGVRMALGARRVEVVRLVVRQGMGIALAGIGVGVLGALALTRVMSSLLYEVQPRDLQTFVVVAAALATTALAACGVPALKAARVDPAIALRRE